MATIATTAFANPLRYPAQPHIDKLTVSGGAFPHFYACFQTGSTSYQMYKSIDGGSSWGTTDSSQTRSGLQEVGPIVCGNDNCAYIVYRVSESNLDKIYVRRFPFTTQVWESEQLLGSVANGGVAGAVWSGLAMHAAFVSGTQILVAVGAQSGSLQGVKLLGGRYDGSSFSQPSMFLGTSAWYPDTASGRIGPSVSTEHTGDYHTAPTPHLWVTFGRTNVYLVKLGYASGAWTGPSSATLVKAGVPAQDGLCGVFDGTRWLMCSQSPDDTTTVDVWERNKANTTTTRRMTPVHPQGVIRQCAVTYDVTTGNMRVFAVGTTIDDLYYVDYLRGSDLWGSWSLESATDIKGISEWGLRRGNQDDTKYSVYRFSETGANDTITHDLQTITFGPLAPTWASPAASGAAADVAAPLLLDWNFLDPDPADAQTAYALSRQIGAGAVQYFRASDSSWQATEQKNLSGTSAVTLAASWGAGSDANHSYAVKVWDGTDQASVYSAAMVVVPSVKVNPTITSPTAAQVITTSQHTMTWTAAEETAYRITLTNTTDALLMLDTGFVSSAALSYVLTGLMDTKAYTVTLETKNTEGLVSTQQTRAFTVSYLGPDTPTLVGTPTPSAGYIAVAITNPAPTGGRPSVATNTLYRRETAVGGDGVLVAKGLAASATYNDWRPVAGVAYQYRVLATGTNGAATFGAWTS